MGWGIANDLYGETWALTQAGLFAFHEEFRENTEVCKDPFYRGGQEARSSIPAGEWLAFQWSIQDFCTFFMFMARFASVYELDGTIRYELMATSIEGRKLASVRPTVAVSYGIPEPCRAKGYLFGEVLAVGELRANWEDHCAQAMKRFFQLFPDHQVSEKTLRDWVEHFKERRLSG